VLRVSTPLPADTEEIVTRVISSGLAVHRALGPGFLESIYRRALCLEMHAQGIPFEPEKNICVPYREWQISGQRVDLIVGGQVIVEIKTVDRLERIHEAQVLSYLRSLRLRIGLLMNFNVPLFKDGLRRIVL